VTIQSNGTALLEGKGGLDLKDAVVKLNGSRTVTLSIKETAGNDKKFMNHRASLFDSLAVLSITHAE
jgi:hypothetical protein